MTSRAILIAALVFCLSQKGFAISPASNCEADLASRTDADNSVSSARPLTPTENFQAYIETLLVQDILKPAPFAAWTKRLESGELVNPIVLGEPGSTALIHYDGLQKFLVAGNLDREALRAWAAERSGNLADKAARIQTLQEDTLSPEFGRPMRFHTISAGDYPWVENGKSHPNILPRSIEVMDTPVTQGMWAREMRDNPSVFRHGQDAAEFVANKKIVTLQPNHPVENITWWSALEFANRISIRNGFEPFYKLPRKEGFKEWTSAEAGTLEPYAFTHYGQVNQRFPQGKGYRLPSAAEYLLLLKTGVKELLVGAENPHTAVDLEQASWTYEKEKRTVEVYSPSRSLRINGKVFQSLFGNVQFWRTNEDDDFNRSPKRFFSVTGSSFSSDVRLRNSRFIYNLLDGWDRFTEDSRNLHIGMILVRTVDE